MEELVGVVREGRDERETMQARSVPNNQKEREIRTTYLWINASLLLLLFPSIQITTTYTCPDNLLLPPVHPWQRQQRKATPIIGAVSLLPFCQQVICTPRLFTTTISTPSHACTHSPRLHTPHSTQGHHSPSPKVVACPSRFRPPAFLPPAPAPPAAAAAVPYHKATPSKATTPSWSRRWGSSKTNETHSASKLGRRKKRGADCSMRRKRSRPGSNASRPLWTRRCRLGMCTTGQVSAAC